MFFSKKQIIKFVFYLFAAVPGAPSTPEILDVSHDGMTLTWRPPEHDGGSSVAGYIIDRKEVGSDRWVRINKNPVTMTRYRATGLVEGLEYEYRVTAINSRGAGKPSENSKAAIAMDPIGMYQHDLVKVQRDGFIEHLKRYHTVVLNTQYVKISS